MQFFTNNKKRVDKLNGFFVCSFRDFLVEYPELLSRQKTFNILENAAQLHQEFIKWSAELPCSATVNFHVV